MAAYALKAWLITAWLPIH